MNNKQNLLAISIDLDEWYQCRWATGSEKSMWSSTQQFFNEYYHTDSPKGEIIPLVEIILQILEERALRATFFVTGEIANYYPEMLRLLVSNGHEIGCHNMYHRDYGPGDQEIFRHDVRRSKALIESIIGKEVLGYRAPNSVIHPYMITDLKDAGFLYDSSVTPTRSFRGKFSNSSNAEHNPYQLSNHSFSHKGSSGLWELPWPVFPLLRTPAGSGITTRMFGRTYTYLSIDSTLKTGDTVYYFHPYEIGKCPHIDGASLYIKLFLKGLGNRYRRTVESILDRYEGRICACADIVEKHILQNDTKD